MQLRQWFHFKMGLKSKNTRFYLILFHPIIFSIWLSWDTIKRKSRRHCHSTKKYLHCIYQYLATLQMLCDATYPLSDRTSPWAFSLSACVHHFLNPDGIPFLSISTHKERNYLVWQTIFVFPLKHLINLEFMTSRLCHAKIIQRKRELKITQKCSADNITLIKSSIDWQCECESCIFLNK